MSASECQHEWQLSEGGYVRQWHTVMDEETKTVVAYYGSSEDWGEDGDGKMYLECLTCYATTSLPDGWEIDYQ
jgi:hypothetical protein